jgi:hypothetical protein
MATLSKAEIIALRKYKLAVLESPSVSGNDFMFPLPQSNLN